jgi:hypothetical protein
MLLFYFIYKIKQNKKTIKKENKENNKYIVLKGKNASTTL